MFLIMRQVIFHLLCLLLVCATLGLTAHGAWHVQDATYRRELQVEDKGSAKVCATTTVFLDDRYSGFVLYDAKNKQRVFHLLNRVGSQVSIYFDAVPNETLYLYPSSKFELPSPGGPPPGTGLRHEVRAYDGSEVKSLTQFNQLWKPAPFQGAAFTDRVYSSFNPFGPNAGTLHRFDGSLMINKRGVTTFCTASTDASFLLLNDQEVVSWPGKHDVEAGLNGSKRGKRSLQKGIYRFTYLHANSADSLFAIAAMVPPGEKQHVVISPELFTRASYAYVGPLTGRDGKKQADFIWENRYQMSLRGHVMHKMVFEAPVLGDEKHTTYEWAFGDGTRASGREVEHLVFKRGDFPVKLSISSAGRKRVCSQTARVLPRYGQSERNDKRALALLEKAVKQERERGIQPQGYGLISRGWFFFLREKEAAAFAPRVLAAIDRIPEEDLNAIMIELALGVQQVDEQYELAEACFRSIIENVKDPTARAFAALHCSGMLNLCLNRPEDARRMQQAIKRGDLQRGDQRLLDIYRADTAMVLDNVATARKMYKAIPRPKAPIINGKLNRDAIFDYNSRYFRLRNLLSQGLYRESLQALDLLEWETPEARASPRMNLMKVRALIGNHQPKKAVVCLQRALLAAVDETYTPKLRLELARLYVGMNRFAQAKYQINMIRKESPWSREELAARQLAKAMEAKMRNWRTP